MRSPALATLLIVVALPLSAQPFSVHGYLAARGISVKSAPSWTEGGEGRFDAGAAWEDDRREVSVNVAQLGFDWTPARWFTLHADGVARHEPSGTGGSRGGVVQAYFDVFTDHVRLRAGSFWLPTSRENTDRFWNSPYMISYSALNAWIGQEVRPTGVDLQYSPNFYVTAGATVFRDNDTMGTALAARGWTSGSRLSVYDEDLPLPYDGTTTPFTRDLDGDNGYAGRIRLQLPERAMLQVTRIDNRAELVPLIRGHEPWRTRFDVVGAQWGITAPTTVAAEWASGWTAVGFPGGSFTMDFETSYILLSHERGKNRWSARAERFSTGAHGGSARDRSREEGDALTFAWLRQLGRDVPGRTSPLRLGVEYAHINATPGEFTERAGGGSQVTVELRYGF